MHKLSLIPLSAAICGVIGGAPATTQAASAERKLIQRLEHRVEELESKLSTYETRQPAEAPPAPTPARAEEVEDLHQKVNTLERKFEVEQEVKAADKAKQTASIVAGPEGFGLKSNDNAFQLRLGGLIQADGRWFFNGESASNAATYNNDEWLFRRIRPILQGTVYNIFDFRIMPDFAGNRMILFDGYVDARFFPWFQVRGGKFKTPFGIERLQQAAAIRFAERALPNNLVPNRDLGVELHGDIGNGLVNYSVAWLNGVADGRSSDDWGDFDNNVDKDVAARLFTQPFQNSDIVPLQGLGVGFAISYVDASTGVGDVGSASYTNLPSYRSAGQQTFFSYRGGTTSPTVADGTRLRWTPQLFYGYGPFSALGEYVHVTQDVRRTLDTARRTAELSHNAWQVALSYVLTGEESTYAGVRPKRPFSIENRTWGAWEVVGRYNELNVDKAAFTAGANSFADPTTAARQAAAYGVGLNWYLNNFIKVGLSYEHTWFRGGGGGTITAPRDRHVEDVLESRLQLAF